ncbi:hypothetical protein PR048_023804 [Dryococelus australis]|uniref:Uncharacterized protein n=1 Tax=Dryococelus australis TaxID=614101 RepID=A0ABQ9GV48_9NEOP|nr:hypothetical protein PR048_023804 [Dryococelus australis]
MEVCAHGAGPGGLLYVCSTHVATIYCVGRGNAPVHITRICIKGLLQTANWKEGVSTVHIGGGDVHQSIVLYLVRMRDGGVCARCRAGGVALRLLNTRGDDILCWSGKRPQGGGNLRALRKPADLRHRSARFLHAKTREPPGRGLNPVCLGARRVGQPLSHLGPRIMIQILLQIRSERVKKLQCRNESPCKRYIAISALEQPCVGMILKKCSFAELASMSRRVGSTLRVRRSVYGSSQSRAGPRRPSDPVPHWVTHLRVRWRLREVIRRGAPRHCNDCPAPLDFLTLSPHTRIVVYARNTSLRCTGNRELPAGMCDGGVLDLVTRGRLKLLETEADETHLYVCQHVGTMSFSPGFPARRVSRLTPAIQAGITQPPTCTTQRPTANEIQDRSSQVVPRLAWLASKPRHQPADERLYCPQRAPLKPGSGVWRPPPPPFRNLPSVITLRFHAPIASIWDARNRIRLEIASQKQTSDTVTIPYDRVERCQERKINIKASERASVDVFTRNKRPCSQDGKTQFFCPRSLARDKTACPKLLPIQCYQLYRAHVTPPFYITGTLLPQRGGRSVPCEGPWPPSWLSVSLRRRGEANPPPPSAPIKHILCCKASILVQDSQGSAWELFPGACHSGRPVTLHCWVCPHLDCSCSEDVGNDDTATAQLFSAVVLHGRRHEEKRQWPPLRIARHWPSQRCDLPWVLVRSAGSCLQSLGNSRSACRNRWPGFY